MLAGLTGGIGSGKSTVATMLREFGALIVDTDLIAREAVAPNSDGFLQIAREWPETIRDGELDRALLADIVFPDPSQRERLNAIVHPLVRRPALPIAILVGFRLIEASVLSDGLVHAFRWLPNQFYT